MANLKPEDVVCGGDEADGDWWCPKCQAFVSAEAVRFDETHASCGIHVAWVPIGEEPPAGEGEGDGG